MKDAKIISTFKNTIIFDALWMLLSCVGVLFFIIWTLVQPLKSEIVYLIAFQLFFLGLLTLGIYVLNGFKRISINLENQKLTHYNLLRPFGKTMDLNNFVGYIKASEITDTREMTTVYLVNHKGNTQFKINVKYYKNASRLLEGIGLEEIKNCDFGVLKHLKLIFFGKIQILKDF